MAPDHAPCGPSKRCTVREDLTGGSPSTSGCAVTRPVDAKSVSGDATLHRYRKPRGSVVILGEFRQPAALTMRTREGVVIDEPAETWMVWGPGDKPDGTTMRTR